METSSKRHMFLKALACLGQLASLFPFAVFFEALGLNKLVVWEFLVIYAVWILFRGFGWLVGKLINSLQQKRLPKRIVPLTNFLSRIGFVVPAVAFIMLGIWLKPDFSVYFYILPAGIIIYFGGNLSVGRSYSDIFSRAWLLFDLIASIIVMIGLAFSNETEVSSAAGYALCVGFAVVVLLSAVLANQTNIDTRTNQRDAGKAVLPEGLRRYNALLVIGTVGLTLGLFVFAKPLADLLRMIIGNIIKGVLFIIKKLSELMFPEDEVSDPAGGLTAGDPPLVEPANEVTVGNIIFIVFLIALIVLLILFRKQVINAIKSLFAPLFRSRDKSFDRPFADEITSSHAKQASSRAQKKAERELERQYARETLPERKYRLGYALFLVRLRRTEHPPVPSDTTDAHREKGERAFGEDLRSFSETYSRVRYADYTPTVEELAEESELLRRIR